MAIDFCCASLKTSITSLAVNCEGYDVCNLLSSNPLQREKGFLAEGFTKPPISVYLNFFCNVDISHILIWGEVGCQKSNGLELLITPGSHGTQSEKKNHNNYDPKSRTETTLKIGSCKLKDEPGVAFQKFYFRTAPTIPSNFLIKHFNTSSANALRNASSLEVKIFSTANSSVPALKKIQIWGQPSRSCPENISQLIFKLWNQNNSKSKCRDKHFKNDSASGDKNFPDGEQKRKEYVSEPSSSENEILTPDEFLDSITYNIMAIPMTLPSGKVIDLSTLEKFEVVESSWGRSPSDPFTGIPFTQSMVPVPDVALKSRIDRFLLEHGHLEQFKGVGRTVGHEKSNHSNMLTFSVKKDDCVTLVEQLKNNFSSSQSHLCPSSSLPTSSNIHTKLTIENKHTATFSSVVDNDIATKLEENTQFKCTSNNCDVADKTTKNNGTKRKNDMNLKSLSGMLCKKSKDCLNVRNHEDIVEDSLDYAMESVLTGLPSFVKTTVESRDSSYKNSKECFSGCGQCQSVQCLFSLPCNHLLCRNCLVNKSSKKIESMKCAVCSHSYSSGDVKRFHLL